MSEPHRPIESALRRLVLGGLIALALLAIGETAPAVFPVPVLLTVDGASATVWMDGQLKRLDVPTPERWKQIRLVQPGPLEREYQIDGTDQTFTLDRNESKITSIQNGWHYQLLAWLRDESGYSRWRDLQMRSFDGKLLAQTPEELAALVPPERYSILVSLSRPEAPAFIRLTSANGDATLSLELDRERRRARWVLRAPDQNDRELLTWFFPEQPMPFAAGLMNQFGRSAAAGYVFFLGVLAVGAAAGWVGRRLPIGAAFARATLLRRVAGFLIAPDLLMAVWFASAIWVTVRLYHQLPHVLDAVSYVFQSKVFRSGRLFAVEPPISEAFRGPFQMLSEGRWFSQYPPGAPAVFALGDLIGMGWMMGSIATLLMLGVTGWASTRLFGRATGVATVALGVLSPLILFQAGSFLSHSVGTAALAGTLAALVKARISEKPTRWYLATGAMLGAAFMTRETPTVLVGVVVFLVLIYLRAWRAIGLVVLGGLPFAAMYAGYNWALTGAPWLPPRLLLDGTDHLGFGDNVGFYGRHTPAAGLVVIDELLTLLQIDLFGWPMPFTLGVMALPFLLGRATRLDYALGGGFLLFGITYTAYFTHGVGLGPRYYYEALPFILPLTVRGITAATAAARSLRVQTNAARFGATVAVGLLFANSALYYLPRQIERRTDFASIPGDTRIQLAFVEESLFGARVTSTLPAPSLILVRDWFLFNNLLASLNCVDIPNCPYLFALIGDEQRDRELRQQYPGRLYFSAQTVGSRVLLSPSP